MIKFSKWLFDENRDTADLYKNILNNVPQDIKHHPEGDVLVHSRLVRKAIPNAILTLQTAQSDVNNPLSEILKNLDLNLTVRQEQILNMTAWLHDIGKRTSTTIDGENWEKTSKRDGKIQAIGHQSYNHFMPQIEKFRNIASPETIEFYEKNQEIINWIIEHHMDFTSGHGFSKKFVRENFDGKYVKNIEKMKLLLIIMWADKMGRRPEDSILQAVEKNADNLLASAERSDVLQRKITTQSSRVEETPEEFASRLKANGVHGLKLSNAIRGRFSKLRQDQVNDLIQENFKNFASKDDFVILDAEIPTPDDVFVLRNALTMNGQDEKAVVLTVGGAVRDYLFAKFNDKLEGFSPKDTDVTTNLSEKEILERLRSTLASELGVAVKEKESVDTFGVVFATVNRGETIEIAPFRKDIGSADGRRPDRVEQADVYEDAMRRDLTINNLYYDFVNKKILDFNPNGQGIEDIKNGIARPVGDPFQRFEEDKLRVLRLVRFFSRFNSGSIVEELDNDTLNAIKKFKDLRRHNISPERIQSEFTSGLLQSLNTSMFVQNYLDLGLIESVFPGLKIERSEVSKLENCKRINVILAWLLKYNKNINEKLNELKYSNETSKSVQFLIDSLNFEKTQSFLFVKRRKQQLLGKNAFGPGGNKLKPDEIEQKNQEISAQLSQDLYVFAKLSGNDNVIRFVRHLSGVHEDGKWIRRPYEPPKIDSQELVKQGLKGKEIGEKINQMTMDDYEKSLQSFDYD